MKAHHLHVVTAISNPVRFKSRYALYNEFAKRVADAGAQLWTIELALGERPFEVTMPDETNHIQLRTKHEIWHKENLLNLAINRLPEEAKYIAWVDADVQFARPDWAEETVQQLQHYHVVQMFSQAQDVGPNYEMVGPIQNGFMYSYLNGDLSGVQPYQYAAKAHPGYAWAARRAALDKVGGLIDYAILGSADAHMACALIGKLKQSVHHQMHNRYVEELMRWQQHSEAHIRRNVGYVAGMLTHFWHGKKLDRRYCERWEILVKNGFHPAVDLKRDAQGLYQLTARSIKLRDQIRAYFRARNEDSIDV